VAKDTVLGIRSRRFRSGVPVGVLVVDNRRRIAQKVVAPFVQQRRDSHRHRREQRDGREQRGKTGAPEGADHK